MSSLILLLGSCAPLLLAALGGLTSERSGVVNIALEGKMLIACFFTAVLAPRYGVPAAIGGAIFASVSLSVVHWVLTQQYRMDAIISGMAINLFAAGASSFLKSKWIVESQMQSNTATLWVLYLLALLIPVGMAWVLHKTRFGVQLRASGSDPDKARLVGINVLRVRLYSLVLTGVFCGLAGSQLYFETSTFTDNMTAGRGFIALAALILGGWRSIPAAIACIAFGAVTSLQVFFNGKALGGVLIPSEAWKALPYLVTIIALCGLWGKSGVPKGLGKV